VLRVLADLQFSEREFQTAGALTEKALADKASVTLGAVSRSRSRRIFCIDRVPSHSVISQPSFSHF